MAGKPTERASCFFDEGNIGEAPCLGSLSEMTGILKFVLEAWGEI